MEAVEVVKVMVVVMVVVVVVMVMGGGLAGSGEWNRAAQTESHQSCEPRQR